MRRPAETDYAPFFAGYVSLVTEDDVLSLIEQQSSETQRLISSLDEQRAMHRYAEGKWTVKEVIGHVTDAERVFGYRLTRIARGDKTPLAGFDENEWAKTAPHRWRPIKAVVDELIAVRRATLALMDSLDDTAIGNSALANNNPISGRAL